MINIFSPTNAKWTPCEFDQCFFIKRVCWFILNDLIIEHKWLMDFHILLMSPKVKISQKNVLIVKCYFFQKAQSTEQTPFTRVFPHGCSVRVFPYSRVD